MKRINKVSTLVLSLCMAICFCVAVMYNSVDFAHSGATNSAAAGYSQSLAVDNDESLESADYDDSDVVKAIVTLDGDSLLGKFVAQKKQISGELSQFLEGSLAQLLGKVNDTLKDEILRGMKKSVDFKLLYSFDVVTNAIAIEVRYGDLDKIRSLSGVERVEIAADRQLLLSDDCGDDYYYKYFEESATCFDNYNEDNFTNNKAFSVDNSDSNESANMSQTSTADPISGNILASDVDGAVNSDGTLDTSGLDYKGEGMLIGIIDSAALPNHEAFSISPSSPKYETSSYLSAQTLSRLNAKTKMAEVSADDLFVSKKMPYAFDYQGGDTDLTGVSHGVRVAGIAAGNNGSTFFGSAPEAQLAVFKVYTEGGSASDADIVAAIEDAILIGVDVINMSFGVPGGFMNEYAYEGVFESIAAAGIIACNSAGNNYTSAYKSANGDISRLENPDDSALAYPASHKDNIAVASFSKMGTSFTSTSWGPAADLTLKPEIATAGISIKSASSGTSTYGEQSGTSMASPNASGGAAVIKQYLSAQGLSGQMLIDATSSVLTASAIPLTVASDYYSPRVQGAGFASLLAATKAGAYITTEGTNKAKLEFGHDPEKTGVFTKEFSLKSISDFAQSYYLSGVVQTDEQSGSYIKNTPYKLSAQVSFYIKNGENYTLITNNRLELSAGAEKTVRVMISLSHQDKAYLGSFPNGNYVDGFVFLTADSSVSGGEYSDLSMPFLGFFGDWLSAPIFETDNYGANSLQTTAVNSGFYAGNSSLATYLMGSYLATDIDSNYKNSLDIKEQGCLVSSPEYAAIGYVSSNRIFHAQFGLLRGAVNVHYTLTDPVTGEVLYSSSKMGDMLRSMYDGGSPFNSRVDINFSPISLYNQGKLSLKNNTVLLFSLNASIEYGDYENRVDDSITLPIYIDLETPVMEEISIKKEGGKDILSFTTADNHYVRTVQMYYKNIANTPFYRGDGYGIAPAAFYAGARVDVDIEITDFLSGLKEISKDGILYVEVEDFARNKLVLELKGIKTGTTSWNTAPTAPSSHEVVISYEEYDGETFVENGATYYQLTSGENAGGYVLLRYDTDRESGICPIKEGTVRIASYAFAGAHNLTSVQLPSSLLSIGEGAFWDCSGMLQYRMLGMTAPLLEMSYTSFTAENKRPYTHFGDIYNPPQTKFLIKTGATGFDSLVWNTYITARETSGLTVAFDSKGGTAVPSQTVFANETVSAPENPMREGYDFAGWFTSSDYSEEFVFGNSVTENTVLYAKWTIKSFSVIYIVDCEGAVPTQADVDFGESFVVANFARTGYVLVGWYDQHGKIYAAGDEYGFVDSAVVLTAIWEVEKFTLTFENIDLAPLTMEAGTAIIAPSDPVQAHYTFTGWFEDEDCTIPFVFDTMPNRDISVYAGWEINSYAVTYILGCEGEAPTQSDIDFGGAFLVADFVRTGYVLVGWRDQHDNVYSAGDEYNDVSGEVVLTAIWEVEKFTVTFEGADLNPLRLEAGATINLPTPTKAHHSFRGWFEDEDCTTPFTIETMPAQNITVYADWEINTYRLILIAGHEYEQESVSGKYGETIVLPTPPDYRTKTEQYTFVGWFLDENCTTAFEGTTFVENLTLYAGWEGGEYGCNLNSCSTIAPTDFFWLLPLLGLCFVAIRQKRSQQF